MEPYRTDLNTGTVITATFAVKIMAQRTVVASEGTVK